MGALLVFLNLATRRDLFLFMGSGLEHSNSIVKPPNVQPGTVIVLVGAAAGTGGEANMSSGAAGAIGSDVGVGVGANASSGVGTGAIAVPFKVPFAIPLAVPLPLAMELNGST